MDTFHLDELIERLRHYQSAVGRAKGTTERYHYTFRQFGRFLDAEGLPRTSAVLTTEVMERFARWLRDTIEPRFYDRTSGLAHARHRRRVRLGIGLVGQREMSHEAHNADLPSPSPPPCACDRRVLLMYRQPSRAMPVSM